MIEAVNSTLLNASLLRGNAEQAGTARSFAANPDRVQEAAVSVPQAPFVSPFIALDVDHNTAVLQIRDSETGDVVTQFPSEQRLEAQSRRQAGNNISTLSETVNENTANEGIVREDNGSGDGGVASDLTGQAQIASAALNTGAQAGVRTLSAGVSVLA